MLLCIKAQRCSNYAQSICASMFWGDRWKVKGERFSVALHYSGVLTWFPDIYDCCRTYVQHSTWVGEVEWRRSTVSWGAWLIIADEWQACLTEGYRCALTSRITHYTCGRIWNLLFSLWYLLSCMLQSRHTLGFYERLLPSCRYASWKWTRIRSSAQPGNIPLSQKYLSPAWITGITVK